MSFTDEYLKLRKKREEEEIKKIEAQVSGNSFSNEYSGLRAKRVVNESDDDIAPVATTTKKDEDEEERTWFKAGAFDDGYQFGDVAKTILGTVGDAGVGVLKGISRMGEGVGDLLSYGVAAANDAVGLDEYADEIRKRASESVTDRLFGGMEKKVDKYSILGDKSDSVSEDIGQVATINATGGLAGYAGLGTVGATAATTGLMGLSSMGSGMGEAYIGGATDEEAATYGLIKGAVDAGSELLFGGLGKAVGAIGLSKGLTSVDDMLAKKLSERITNRIAKNFVQYGVKASAEGLEEVIAGVGSAMAKQATYMSDKELSELLEDENLMEQFVVGAVTSGIAQSGIVPGMKSGSLAESIQTDRDFITGLSTNEQKVIEKVFEDRIAEAESEGKPLTNKEKDKIYDAVVSDMEKGYISTDTIEEVLGGETFKAYKDTVDSEDALQKEFDTLNKMKQGEMTGEQIDRRTDLKAQLEEIKTTGKRNQMKSKLGEEVFGLVQNDRLMESYNERGRRSQAFEADLTKYDAKQQETIKKAVESGILNNTNRTHEFVDMIAKISADKGVLFDFTNNEKLKGSVFAVDGKQVNGFVTKDGVTLNIDSAKSLNSVVGHEITHVLEGTELYTALQSAVVEYAKSKGDYQGRYDSLVKLYEGVKDANVDAELTADLVGDYLFTDADFIHNLSTNHRNVFQKVYDEIKYLCKVATAGSKEARELEKVKRASEKAYQSESKSQGDAKYSLDMVDAVQPKSDKWSRTHTTEEAMARFPNMWNVAAEESEVRNPTQITSTVNSYRKIYNSLKNEGFSGTILDASSGLGYGTRAGIEEYGFDVDDIEPYPDKNYSPKYQDYSALNKKYDVIISNAVLNVLPQDQRDALAVKMGELLADGGRLFVNVRGKDVETLAKTGKNIHLGNMEWIETVKGSYQKGFTKPELVAYLQDALGDGFTVKPTSMFGAVSAVVTKDGTAKYSLSDSDGKQLTAEQQEYFKDSKMRDENGNLKVMYHGSQDAGFHVFDAKMSDDDTSFFFVDRNDVAASYSGTSEVYEAKTIRTAEDMNNFLAEIGYDQYKAVEKDGKYELLENNEHVAWSDTAQGIYEEFCWYEGVGEGDANYKVYLNLKNPLVVDADGRNWNNVSREFSQEVADRYNSLTAEEKAALHDIAGWGEVSIFRDEIHRAIDKINEEFMSDAPDATIDDNTRLLADAYKKLNEPNMYDLFSIAEDNFSEEAIKQFAAKQMNTRDYAKRAKAEGYDGVIFQNIVDVGGYGNGSEGAATVAIAFDSNQIKSVANAKPTADADIRYSMSEQGETPKTYGKYNVTGKDIRLETQEETQEETQVESEEVLTSAPVSEETAMFPEDAPIQTEIARLEAEKAALEDRMMETQDTTQLEAEWWDIQTRIEALRAEEDAAQSDRLASLDDADAPPEMEAPITEDAPFEDGQAVDVKDPFAERDVPYGNEGKKVNAYMYDNPEVKPFFQAEALALMEELNNGTKGERWYNDHLYYESGGEQGYGGVKRHQSESIDRLSYEFNLSYEDIEKGLEAIIKDNGAENIAAAKKIEFVINDRLMKGYKPFGPNLAPDAGRPNQDYIALMQDKQRVDSLADATPPVEEDIAPVKAAPKTTEKYEAIRPKPTKEPKLARATPAEQARAEILTEEPKVEKKSGAWGKFKNLLLDKGMVFEDLSLATGNRELQARWNSIRYAESKAQRLMEKGNASVSSLKSIRETVEKSGKTKQFYEYLYHMHNADRMTLAQRFKDTPNKPVFGDSVTADVSTEAAANLERANPEFKQYAKEVYSYMGYLREMLVDGGVISGETAKLWQEMYPHYVPIRRMGDEGLNINVPLDTGRTGINAPVKRAKGGSRDILPLFDTMGQRTIQTYKAIAKNRFGVELKNTLGTTIENEAMGLDEIIDGIDTQDGLLQEGKNGQKPTFTVFENGEKVTFEITEEMYDSMKPAEGLLATTSKTLNTVSNIRRGTLTEYNPRFLLKNAVKDVQDVLMNSQHATRTYLSIPKALNQMRTNGHWYAEYMENGGDQNSYFDTQTNTFTENKALEIAKTVTGLNAISKANNIIERLPRLAEYIASREMGRSVDVAMLDAARVTTNFAAGGDATKWLNRNGVTFLNASVQGALQQARNIREAKMNGLKGWASLAGKFIAAGLPALALNHLLWDDDDEYEELADYVKENYYIVGKYGDGQFVRIPKGRTVAVIQNAFEQMENAITGNDEVDLKTFVDLVVTNLAPNNPFDNNILSPIVDVITNETWYGEDLVPTRLQDLPAAEQYDESTDSISRWLGDTFNVSPYKANYLLDQYSGVIGDTFLPYLTPEAEGGENSLFAPLMDMFTTDSVMNNQNVSDFYDKKDELTKNANSSKATDRDILMSKYLNSVGSKMGELYGKKREIQNSDMPDAAKYEEVRAIQNQIDSLARDSLNAYQNVSIDGVHATVADRQYRLKDGTWTKLTDEQIEKQEKVTNGLGIKPSEYWSNKEEYDFAYEKPEKYAVAKSVGGYEAYKGYSSELYDIKGEDRDGDGRSDTGTRKEKVIDWINNLDADYGTKIILFKNEYNADDTYNYEIVDYLNGREDISYEDMVTILKELGFEVSGNNISW